MSLHLSDQDTEQSPKALLQYALYTQPLPFAPHTNTNGLGAFGRNSMRSAAVSDGQNLRIDLGRTCLKGLQGLKVGC